MENKTFTFDTEVLFLQTVVGAIRSRILTVQEQGRVFRLALSGGTTPGPIYRQLARMPNIDWSMVELYLVDERCVPLDNPDSNFRMMQVTLLDHLPVPPGKFVFFDTNLSIEDSLKKYESQLVPSQHPFFDLVLLGLGNDGHTASLFPNDSLLKQEERWVGYSSNGNPVPERLTLTYPALESSTEIFFLIKGKSKADILHQVQNAPSQRDELPAARLFASENSRVYYSTT